MMAIAGYPDHELLDLLFTEIQNNYDVISPNHVINGTWCPAIRPGFETTEQNNSMYFGFYTGELLRGLALYMKYFNLYV